MSIKNKVLSRAGSLVGAMLIALGALVPAIVPMVSAAGQVQTRSIEMSDATPAQTGVVYSVTFTPATTAGESMVIDFCSDGSIIGSTCTPPTGMDASAATFSGITGWNVGSPSFAGPSTVAIHDTAAPTNALGTSAITFTLTGVQNPSTTGSFWARVYTYNDDSYGGGTPTGYVDPTDLGTSMVDYGGFALSTTSLINITATVMETLTFCVNKAQPGAACTTLSTPVNLTLGHGSPKVIDSTQADTDDAYFQVSTNALTGVAVRMKTHNTCGGLSRDNGSTCPITAQGASASAFAVPNTAEFGLNVATVAGGTGTLVPQAPYSTASQYGMDDATGGNTVQGTYGTEIATTNSTASASLNGHLTFAAQANVTTPAGVYSANESLIATGTF